MAERSDRSVSIGGDAAGNAIQTGDQNVASVQFTQTTLPPAERVDIQAEFSSLRELLRQIKSPDEAKIARALEDANDELEKPQPDRDEVGQALQRALGYAQQADDFAQTAVRLQSHVTRAVGWLGENWHKLLGLVGLTL